MNITTIVGARPQFIKAAAISRAVAQHNAAHPDLHIRETIVHTGQHFDENMSEVFFRELGIPRPHHHLGIGGGQHGEMTGRMLEAIERILLTQRPDWVLVYGDTNSTLAGALAAVKLHVPIAHVEAGLRSFNRNMPEEINRILTDHASTLLFVPTATAHAHLRKEGIGDDRIARVGDVMYDVMLYYRQIAQQESVILRTLDLQPRHFILATIHRAENTDDFSRLSSILHGLQRLSRRMPVILPMHPRTRKALAHGLDKSCCDLCIVDPVGYLDMVMLESSAALIATDSGGVQKEAYFNQVPCITLRDETEWSELLQEGANALVGANADLIESMGVTMLDRHISSTPLYGTGNAAGDILKHLLDRTPSLTKNRDQLVLNA
jgi:UDP-GlcNAc3NAcA epimerase